MLEIHHEMGGKGTGAQLSLGLVRQIEEEVGGNLTHACPRDPLPE